MPTSIAQLRAELTARVQAAFGQTMPSLLAEHLRPAIYLHPGAEPRPGQSHLGGWPEGVTEWPQWEGRPMLFLLAVHLPELGELDADGDLPRQGWLNFFVAEKALSGQARTGVKVDYVSGSNSRPLAPPEPGLIFPPRGLTFSAAVHDIPQDYELASFEESDLASREWAAIGYDTGIDTSVLPREDFLLGRQIFASGVGLEDADGPGIGRRYRALLSITAMSGNWNFIQDTDILSYTFYVQADALRAADFSGILLGSSTT